jgi:hypothetical protein
MRPKPAGVSRVAHLAPPTTARAVAGGRPVPLPTPPARADLFDAAPPATAYLPGDFFTSAAPLPPTPSTALGLSEQKGGFGLSALWDAAGQSTTALRSPSASAPRLGGREEFSQRTFFTPTFNDDNWRQPMGGPNSTSAPQVTLLKPYQPRSAPTGASHPARAPPPGARLSGSRSRPDVSSPQPVGTALSRLAPTGAKVDGIGGSAHVSAASVASTSRSFAPSPTPNGGGGRRRPRPPLLSPGEPEVNDEPPSAVLSDAAWHGRLSAVIAHLHGTLPRFFPDPPRFPPAVFSPAITLVLPAPPSLPLIGSTSSDAEGNAGGDHGTGGRAPEVHLRGTRAYSLFFAAARASLGIVLREPYVRIESVRVVPPTEKEGFVVVPNQLPVSVTGSTSQSRKEGSAGDASSSVAPKLESSTDAPHAGLSAGSAPAVQISRARLERVVRVRVKVGGRLRLPSLGPATAVVEALGGRLATDGGDPTEREWTISASKTFPTMPSPPLRCQARSPDPSYASLSSRQPLLPLAPLCSDHSAHGRIGLPAPGRGCASLALGPACSLANGSRQRRWRERRWRRRSSAGWLCGRG